jgi:hypothetical protein
MVLRDSKGKRRKRAKEPTDAIEPASAFGKQSKGEALLVSKLQKESLKVHSDSLDAPKKAPAKKKGK